MDGPEERSPKIGRLDFVHLQDMLRVGALLLAEFNCGADAVVGATHQTPH
jgi:hypothetical protein